MGLWIALGVLAVTSGCHSSGVPITRSDSTAEATQNEIGNCKTSVSTVDIITGEPRANIPLVATWAGVNERQRMRFRTNAQGRAELRMPCGDVHIAVDADASTNYTGGVNAHVINDSSVVTVRVMGQLR